MMNDENNEYAYTNSKVKKFAIALGSCALLLAIMALAATNLTGKPETITTVPPSETKNVEAKVPNVPDTRNDLTMIVPATEVTTAKIIIPETVIPAEDVDATAAQEETTARPAPVSYTLPLSTDIGTDFSFSVPVYSSVMNDWRTHDGVDFNGAYGDGVKAIAEGIIRDIFDDPILGGVVTIDHGGDIVAAYCGVEASDTIKKGVIVSGGQKIGSLGQIPSEIDAEYPHLHLEIRVGGELTDPLEVLGFNNDSD